MTFPRLAPATIKEEKTLLSDRGTQLPIKWLKQGNVTPSASPWVTRTSTNQLEPIPAARGVTRAPPLQSGKQAVPQGLEWSCSRSRILPRCSLAVSKTTRKFLKLQSSKSFPECFCEYFYNFYTNNCDVMLLNQCSKFGSWPRKGRYLVKTSGRILSAILINCLGANLGKMS